MPHHLCKDDKKCMNTKTLARVASHKCEEASHKVIFESDRSLSEAPCRYNVTVYLNILVHGQLMQYLTWCMNALTPINTGWASLFHPLIQIVHEDLWIKVVGDIEVLA